MNFDYQLGYYIFISITAPLLVLCPKTVIPTVELLQIILCVAAQALWNESAVNNLALSKITTLI